ncbi:hypothetical protein [Nonomuraea wenchangensis]|uniref:hypothetical protein n=1 Tax=Nonomuraea wenchangensis TaxID=568860 RepID=UPI00331E30FF
MRLLIPVLIVAVIAVAVVAIVALRSRVERARQIRHELRRHEQFLDRLRRGALTSADIDPTSAALAVEIAQHLANSKEIR